MLPGAVLYTSREMSPERCDRGIGAPWTLTDWAAIGLLMVLALVPRTVNLLGLDPFIDEAAWTDWAFRQFELTSPRTWIIPLVTDGRPPLLFVWWMVPFGAVVDNGILAGRLASAVAGALCGAALYGLGRELASRTLGVTAGILWALSPFTVFFSRIAADDALLTSLAILATWASVCLARRPASRPGRSAGSAWRWRSSPRRTGCCWPPRRRSPSSCSAGRWRGGSTSDRCGDVRGRADRQRAAAAGGAPLLQQVALQHRLIPPGTGRDLLWSNLEVAAGWAETYVGTVSCCWRAGILAGTGVSPGGLLFVGLLGGGLMLLLRASRRRCSRGTCSSWRFPRSCWRPSPSSAQAGWPSGCRPCLGGRLAASVVVVALVLAAMLGRQTDLLLEVVRQPDEAKIPGSEHMGYVEYWFAVYGLGQVVDDSARRARGVR